MEVKTRAIVLHALKYGDSQMIVDLLTRERGRMSFICHIPKTGKGKLRKQFFQPLTLLYIVYTERPNRNLQRFSDIRLTRPYTSIPFDAYKLAIALFVAEFLTHATRNEQRNESLFDYVESSLAWLDNVTSPFSNFHLVFMMHLTRFVGFFPNLSNDAPGMWFDLRNGAFSLVKPPHPDFVRPSEASMIGLLMRMNFDNMRLFRMTQAQRARCVEIILHFYRLHVPYFPELKSLDVLRALFA
ncbi:DNA repair protein RecO [Hallella colorans]|uniref:DNA repair protein RecO n=1 Tax=Hallella colorans TaxID=1703337 RepID=A0A2U0UAY8_9BACT|nr:DNA repair protein RecO [Hallella colorans]PVX54794.1 DNA replication and repair protein RecO [Hallella colorans]